MHVGAELATFPLALSLSTPEHPQWSYTQSPSLQAGYYVAFDDEPRIKGSPGKPVKPGTL
ncbi:hypothetical protein DXG01_005826, partial [Tephrocybe rancida]